MSRLYRKYGYVIVPKGSILFRQGKIIPEYGAFFALHSNWANNFEVGNVDKVDTYEIKEDIRLLFMVSHLNGMGQPITAIEKIYRLLTKEKSKLNDLDIKWRDKSAKTKFVQTLIDEGVSGWLSTQENSPPLEIFFMPENIAKVVLKHKPYKRYNTLSYLEIFPANRFISKSLNNMKSNVDYLLDKKVRSSKEMYSLFEKLFIETNLLAEYTNSGIQ